ncbi:MAG: hypothetical protein AB8B61_05640 [Cyclobacteriaceae bacterium]
MNCSLAYRRRKQLLRSVLSILLLLGFTFSTAQGISVQVTPDTNAIRIGEQITFSLKLSSQKAVKSAFPSVADTVVNKVEVLHTSSVDTLIKDDLFTYEQKWKVTSFDSGRYVIPPLPFLIEGLVEGKVFDTLYSVPFPIYVGTVAIDTAQAIKPIKDIQEAPDYPINYWLYIGILAAVLVLAAILYFIIKKSKEKDRSILIQKEEEKIPAHEYAFAKLDELEAKKLWQSGKLKAYHSELTEVVKTYIEKRYKVQAVEMTTEELFAIITNSAVINTENQERLGRILTLADMVKFAKKKPVPDENETSFRLAKDLVEDTKLIVEEA